jgi:tRNA A-37 threonylcarbamoyl transferase component Bud32
VKKPGSLIASGRDADIFEYGENLVLRRSRDRRSLLHEARIMTFVFESGYPIPQVHEVSDDGTEIVMERVSGPTMIELVASDPSQLVVQAAELRRLHQRLHEIQAPTWLRSSPFGDGKAILHLDLHPINVIASDHGSVVIDWANASRGEASSDVALTWLLIASGDIPGSEEEVELMSMGRAIFLETFLDGFDQDRLRARLPEVVEWKLKDPHMSKTEELAMQQLVLDTR